MPRGHPFDEDTRKRARALRGTGLTYHALAAEMGVSVGAAWAMCQDDPHATAGNGARRGEAHPKARLRRDDVHRIRTQAAEGVPVSVLARENGCSKNHIRRIVSGDVWSWLSEDDETA